MKLQWKWMKPDRTGIWMFGGTRKSEVLCSVLKEITSSGPLEELYLEGWWCFICDIPVIAPPERKKVKKWLWIRHKQGGLYESEWIESGGGLCVDPGEYQWMETSITREFEQ